MKIIFVVGARPNFIKIAPLVEEAKKYPEISAVLLHTGQHYDNEMSQVFFDELGLPAPDIYLGVGSGSHAIQTAAIMVEFEKICLAQKPTVVVVVGDVNSTLACSLVAAKLQIPIAHVEAGLRSRDRGMPEEINRLVTDALSDLLFTTDEEANKNLIGEGIPESKIRFVGNVMIDTLLKFKKRAGLESKITISNPDYAFVTLHRPSNVDDAGRLAKIFSVLFEISKAIPILFSVHPRTKKQIENYACQNYFYYPPVETGAPVIFKNAINIFSPLPYLDCLNLMAKAKFVLTDSGGIQEETTILGVPCLTLRKNTERPITISQGTNELVDVEPNNIIEHTKTILDGRWKKSSAPKLWDGRAAERIIKVIYNQYAKNGSE